MSEKLTAAVVGLGILGRQHASYLHQHEKVEVVAVCDIRRDVAEQVGARVGAKVFTDLDELLRARTPDLVTVATPDPLHLVPTVAAIRAGVPNIIQEKPLATNVADAEAIVEAVEKAGTRFFINFGNRAAPMDMATRHVIQNGLLGRVVYGESRLDDNIAVPTRMWGQRSREWAAGSSTAHFLLSHVVDLLRYYFAPAEVKQVYAISQHEVLECTADVYDAFLTFDSGLKVRVKAEWIKHIDELVEFYMCFSGDEGTLIYNKRPGFGVDEGWRANVSSTIGTSDLLKHQQVLYDRGINVAFGAHRPELTTGTLAAGGGELALCLEQRGHDELDMLALVGHFIDAIVEDDSEPERWVGNGPLPNHVDGLRQTRVIEAVVESSRRSKVIDLTY